MRYLFLFFMFLFVGNTLLGQKSEKFMVTSPSGETAVYYLLSVDNGLMNKYGPAYDYHLAVTIETFEMVQSLHPENNFSIKDCSKNNPIGYYTLVSGDQLVGFMLTNNTQELEYFLHKYAQVDNYQTFYSVLLNYCER